MLLSDYKAVDADVRKPDLLQACCHCSAATNRKKTEKKESMPHHDGVMAGASAPEGVQRLLTSQFLYVRVAGAQDKG